MQRRHQATLMQPLHRDLQTLNCKTHNRTTGNGVGNCSCKTGWISTPKRKKTILKHLLQGHFKRKSLVPKLRTSSDESPLQPWCSHSNPIYDVQLQKRKVLRMQPRCPATLPQPLQCILQHDVANTNVSTHMAAPDDNNHAAIPMRSATFCNHRFKRCIELRTRQQPLLAEHRGGTNSRMKRPQPHPPHTGGTVHRRCNHFTRKDTGFRAPASSPTQAPCNVHAAITMHFAAWRG